MTPTILESKRKYYDKYMDFANEFIDWNSPNHFETGVKPDDVWEYIITNFQPKNKNKINQDKRQKVKHTFEGKYVNGNYYQKQPNGEFISVNSLSKLNEI